jgi:mRNA-decapping enzyme subunit 2
MEEVASPARLGFQLEQAFWFYDDFYRAENPALPKMNLKKFIQCLLGRYPEWTDMNRIDIDELISAFLKYKAQVPTCGAILLNESLTKCLMVQGWNSGTWTFPKGKIAKGELPEDCAVREVSEEIGYDISSRLDRNDYIQTDTGPHAMRLYIVPGVPESTNFQTLTRKEIGAIRWFPLAELTNPTSANRFFNVNSFIGRLKAFVKKQRKSLELADKITPATGKTEVKKLKPVKAALTQSTLKDSPSKQQKKLKIVQKGQPVVVHSSSFVFELALIEKAFMSGWTKA